MTLESSLAAGGVWAIVVAAVAGLLAGLNPCCLALYPAVAATCCGGAGAGGGRPGASRVIAFVGGTAIATTLLGVVAALAGRAVVLLGRGPRYALALVPILMGLHLLGWIHLPLPSRAIIWRGGGAVAALLAGIFFVLMVGACGTPALAAILSVAAYRGSVAFGALLLFVYALGNGLPLLLVGTALGALARRLTSTPEQPSLLERASGVLVLVLGFYVLVRI